MTFRITLKDPDGFYESIEDAAKESLPSGLDKDETESFIETRTEKLKDICNKWFEYNEYLTVEVDTEANTCTVVPSSTKGN